MEQASGVPLSWFFDQWLKRPGMPALRGGWRYDFGTKQVEIELEQIQQGPAYRIPLEIAIGAATGQPRIERLELTGTSGRFRFPAEAEPVSVTLDPNTWVLMQADFGKR